MSQPAWCTCAEQVIPWTTGGVGLALKLETDLATAEAWERFLLETIQLSSWVLLSIAQPPDALGAQETVVAQSSAEEMQLTDIWPAVFN